MEESKFKNMVVLKNLPSNIIDEAIIVFKTNQKIKRLEKLDNSKNENASYKNSDNVRIIKQQCVIKEAEMLVSEYIEKTEKQPKQNNRMNSKQEKKYKNLKKYAYVSTILLVLQCIWNVVT